MTRIYVCSSNQGKLREFALAADSRFELQSLPNLKEIQPPEETGDTFQQNACAKALYYSQFTDEMVLADDSGLKVDSLGGEPGVYSARYAGLGATDADNNSLLLEKMEPHHQRSARFVSVIALAQQDGLIHTCMGTVEGELLRAPRGDGGFGYDPLFFYPPFNCTLAEVEGPRKFEVSHRGNAVRRMFTWLNTRSLPPASPS